MNREHILDLQLSLGRSATAPLIFKVGSSFKNILLGCVELTLFWELYTRVSKRLEQISLVKLS